MFLLLSVLACFSEKTQEVGAAYCEESTDSIAITDQFEDFSWHNWLDTVGESGQVSGAAALSWEDSGSDCLTWQFIPNHNSASYISSDLTFPDTARVSDDRPSCSDFVEISGSLSLQSGDGRINETIPAQMRRYFDDPYDTEVQSSFDLSPSDLQGSLDITLFEPSSSFSSPSLQLSLHFEADNLLGEVYLETEGHRDDTSWASSTPIAHFDGECPEIGQ